MSTFKQKRSKVKFVTNIQTLDDHHKSSINKFIQDKNCLPEKYEELKKSKQELEDLESSKVTSFEIVKRKSYLKDRINELENEICVIENDTNTLEYITKVADIIIPYYNILHEFNTTNNVSDVVDLSNITTEHKQEEVVDETYEKLKKLNQKAMVGKKEKREVKKRYVPPQKNKPISLLEFFGNKETDNNKTVNNRASLQEKYLTLMNKSYENKTKRKTNILCNTCNIEKSFYPAEGCYICLGCGETEFILVDVEQTNKKGQVVEKQKYPYKKTAHLRERLIHYQAKENTRVPDWVIAKVRKDLIAKRVDLKNCTTVQIRESLDKFDLIKYYDNEFQILYRIADIPPPDIPDDVINEILTRYQNMQPVFREYCPLGERSNAPTCNYLINQFFRQLGYVNDAKKFQLLKDIKRLREQDRWFKKVCIKMGWPFFPTV